MKALCFASYGSLDHLELTDRPQPRPGPGEILVRVAASSINPIDWKLLAGHYRFVVPIRLPFVPGFDVSGQVVETGPGASRFRVGERVFGMLDLRRGGGFAEFATIPESACVLAPGELDDTTAACLPLAGLTALQALRNLGRLRAGQSALVLGAAGGVGHLAVQIACAVGAEVTAVSSSRHEEFVEELGAGDVIDYEREDVRECGELFHVVFDAVGRYPFVRHRQLVRRGGAYVTTRPGPGVLMTGWMAPLVFGRRCHAITTKASPAGLEWLARAAVADSVTPAIARTVALEEVCDALKESQSGHVAGKIAVTLCPPD